MNSKIIILISAIIVIGIITFGILQTGITEENTPSHMEQSNEVNTVLQKIKDDKIANDNSENPYVPKEREWIRAGPFLIDRSEYVLGEKIFVDIEEIDENIKGEIIFGKIINTTHSMEYKKLYYDGSLPRQNYYFGVYPSIAKGFCTTDEIVGEWSVSFPGTDLESLKFEITSKIIPGMEQNFASVC